MRGRYPAQNCVPNTPEEPPALREKTCLSGEEHLALPLMFFKTIYFLGEGLTEA